MTQSLRTFSLMLEAMSELQPELQAAQQARPLPATPSLADSLAQLGPLPREALLLGLASDGLPVLLNLHASQPGPLLVAADPGGGKTALLKLIAGAAVLMHPPERVQFGVISNHPDEWEYLAGVSHSVGVFPTYHDGAEDLLSSLSGWAHAYRGRGQAILLLIDDLESMNDLDFESQQTLRWLLLRGPAQRVWPIITLNTERLNQVESWLEAFRTRIFGCIRDERSAASLSGSPGPGLEGLQAGVQFALQEGADWLRFWIPQVE